MLHAIDSKLKSIYLFVSLFYDTFFALFLYNKETKDKIDLTFESIACNCANLLSSIFLNYRLGRGAIFS